MSAAPETVSASRRLVALGAVALAAFGIALGARESGRHRTARARGAQGPLRRARRRAGQGHARGRNRREDLHRARAEVAVPALPAWQGRAPAARRGRARDRLRRPVHRADSARARISPSSTPSTTPVVPCWPRARAERTAARTSLAATTTCAASARALRRPTSATTRAARSPTSRAAAGKLDSIAVVTAERLQGHPPPADGFRDGKAWIDFRGPPGTIPTVSFVDVVKGRVPADMIRDHIVVVGATAPTLRDVHSTPVGGEELMPGAEVQANAIWTALHGLPLRSAPVGVDILLLALLAMLAPLTRWRLPLGAVGAVTVLAGAGFLAGAQFLFESGSIVDVAAPLVALLTGAFGAIAWSELAERRVRHRVTPRQRTARAARARAHRRPRRGGARDRPPTRRRRGVARRRDRRAHRAHGTALRAARSRGRDERRQRPTCSATPARSTTSARSASATTSC